MNIDHIAQAPVHPLGLDSLDPVVILVEFHDLGRHDNHQFAAVLRIRVVFEQFAQDGNIRKIRHSTVRHRLGRLDQTREHHGLAILGADGRDGAGRVDTFDLRRRRSGGAGHK